MKKTVKILLAFVVAIITMTTAIACNNSSTPAHEHNYKDGICSCGLEKEGYYSEGLGFTERKDGASYAVTSFDKKSGRVVIPAEYEGLPVVEIAPETFLNCPKLTILRLPDSIKEIGEYAFFGCNIVTLTIPKSVETIGTNAFGGCLKLKEIYYNATACSKVVISKDEGANTEIGAFNESGAYDEAGNGITVYIGKEVKSIPGYLFWGGGYQTAARITSIVFEDNSKCEKIGIYAFRSLRNIKSFTFGQNSSLKEIGYEALAEMGFFMSEFTTVVIPESVEKISKRALTMTKYGGKVVAPQFEDINGWYSVASEKDYNLKQKGEAIDISKLEEGSTNVYALAGGQYMYKN